MVGWDNTQEVVQMAILYFLYSFLFSQTSESPITPEHFRMVEDDRYVQYPWGGISFNKLIKSFRQEVTSSKKLYQLPGMTYVLNS